MSIIETIEEQSAFNFTGRINILSKMDKQFLGVILLKDGEIVSASFSKKSGITALYSLVIIDIEDIQEFSLVVEPEVISDEDIEFSLKVSKFKSSMSKIVEEHKESQKLRPPNGLRLIINKDFVETGDKPNSNEFNVLKTIADYNKIEEIYNNCDMFDFEITTALVSLRKKNAIRVIK